MTYLSSFSDFPISFKLLKNFMSTTSNSTESSRTVLCGFVLTNALSWSVSALEDQPLRKSSSRPFSSLRNFLKNYCAVCPIVFPGANVLLTREQSLPFFGLCCIGTRKSFEFATSSQCLKSSKKLLLNKITTMNT